MQRAEAKGLLADNPQLKEKALKAVEGTKDDSEAALNLNDNLSEEDKKALKWSSNQSKFNTLAVLIAEVKDQRVRDAAPIIFSGASYRDVLSHLAKGQPGYDDKIMYLRYVEGSGEGKTFFVRTRHVYNFFRHGGVRNAIPPCVYVTVAEQRLNAVHVYNQHSGVGKTVELCCSAYIRGADLAIYHQSRPEDDISVEEIAGVNVDRQMLAEERVKRIVGEAVEWNQNVFHALKESGIREQLKLVLAIDEASECRTLVRAIIKGHKELGKTAASEFQELLDWKVEIEVLFSVAGTGAAAADIGSLPEEYSIAKPSIARRPELVYDALCRGREGSLPSYVQLKKRHPVLFTFVRYNARFSSIVLEALESDSDYSDDTEGLLIRKVVELFLSSNGISGIADDPQELARAGAQTLAVHLFQEPADAPRNDKERIEWADSYNYGVSLETTTASQKAMMTDLVHKYGLVIALPFMKGEKVQFSVDSAMQLLALFMMGLSPAIDLLEPSSFGYEVLTTHLVKCSIASTLAIQEEKRPTIQEALRKVGCDLNVVHNASLKNISSESDFTDYALWNNLNDMIAVHGEYKERYRETRQHRQVMEPRDIDESQFPVLESNRFSSQDVKGPYLLVDRKLIGAILDMKECPRYNGCFWPPLASVAKGSSPYADGYVSFLAKSRSDESKAPSLCTIMVQAKDYFNGNIGFKKLSENMQRCRGDEISVAFGESRLMCVASRRRNIVASNRGYTYPRDFIMFSTDKSLLLADLMDTLDTQRNSATIHDFTGGIRFAASAASAGGDDDEKVQKDNKRKRDSYETAMWSDEHSL